MADAEEKPSVLIIGGLGYVGRFMALHLHKNNLASEVRLVDKVLPQLAWLAPEFVEACSRDKFMQADATREQSLARIFDRANGKQFDYVFNCGGETRFSQEEEVYKVRSLNLALALGKEATKRGVKAYVELSTGMVYDPKASPRKETDKLKPWSRVAGFKLQAEDEISRLPESNLIVLRLAHVYGDYDAKYVGTALAMARTYQYLNEEMKWLWTEDLRTNTVHVTDLCRAMWEVAEWYRKGKKNWDAKAYGKTPIFNVVDKGNTTQGTMARLIGEIFGIKTGFQGKLISTFAKLNLNSVVEDVNDETLGPWADLLEDAKITRPSPLNPFLEKELLKDTDFSLDGSRLEKVVGFKYEKPELTRAEMESIIESYKRMGWWP